MQPLPATPARPAESAVTGGRRRLKVLSVIFALAFLSIGIRLVDMVVKGDQQGLLAKSRNPAAPETRRADITDRNGELLATDLLVPSVYADPLLIPDIDEAAKALARILPGIDAPALAKKLDDSKRFAWVKHQVTPMEQAAVLELGIPGVGFRYSEQRVYPKQNLTSHLVGFVDGDNHGRAGIEGSFNERLTEGPPQGKDPLVLSLDLRIQQIVHEELASAVRRFRPIGAVGIFYDVRNGEVLSLVSLPDFDPNHVDEASKESQWNRASGNSYELGSLFKIFTTAMALDTGQVSLKDSFDATAPLQIGRYRIHDSHSEGRWLSVPEIFMLSSNIGTARMAFAAGGADPERAFLEKVHLTERPQLEIAELAKPQLPRRWVDITTATVAFGHGVAVAPMSFVEAAAGIVNGGMRAPPTLLKRDPTVPIERERLVSTKTAKQLQFLMWLTVQKGTGTHAQVPGYLVGGKTGTADRADPIHGGYLRNSVISSFAGVFPIDDPHYLVLIMLDDPHGDASVHNLRFGAWTAAPVVREIIARSGPILGVPPSRPGADEALQDELASTLGAGGQGTRKDRHVATVANAQ